jgi:hypothetical protein
MFNIVALLFVGHLVHVAHEVRAGEVHVFTVANDSAGAQELASRIQPVLVAAPGRPLLCMGAAAGSSFGGPVFEETVFDERIRRFMYAQPKYLLDAKAWGADPTDAGTLLKACGTVFPSNVPAKN